MGDIFSTGVTGLGAAQTALSTIAQNVSNANTAGYARQVVDTTTQSATRSGPGYIGNGVLVSGIEALVDPFLERTLTKATGDAAGSSQTSSLFDQIQSVLGDSATGLSAGVASFQSALGQAAVNPSSVPARQLVLTNAGALASTLNSVAASVQGQKQAATQSLGAQVSTANSYLSQIAKLNDAIAKAEPRSGSGVVLVGQQANDLRAQRQLVVNKLSSLATVSTYDQPEGLTVTLGGAAVVVANRASALTTAQDPTDPSKQTVGIATPAGQLALGANSIGGQIGATLNFVANGADQALAQLNHLAGALAQAVNDQSSKGVDLYGAQGSPMFTTSTPSVGASSLNAGNLSVSVQVNAYASLPSDYKLAYSTTSGYGLTRLSDNTVVASGPSLPLSADGITLSPGAGAIANGDSYLIKPFGSQASTISLATRDPKQLAFASPVATSAAYANTSNASISAATVVSPLPLNPNLTSPVSIVFTTPTAYTISGPGIGVLTNQPYTTGAAISYNGWSVSIGGVPNVGDTFSVDKSVGAVGDSSNANQLGKLLNGKTFGSSSESLSDLYANIQSDLGNKTALAHTNATSDTSVLGIAKSQRESFSGVNLDQEAADLARWQQIYSANAQLLSVAQKLFESLLNQI